MHTFRSIANDTGCSKRTVQTWWERAKNTHGELGAVPAAGQARQFTEAEKGILLSYQSDRPAPKPAPVTPVDVEIESGNHCTSITPPSLDRHSFDLSQFRDSEVLTVEDPTAIADKFLAVADLLIDGFDRDAEAREKRLKQTRQAREKVASKAQELQLEQRLYRERTRIADNQQTTETEALQAALAQLQSMGKPTAPGGESA